jgi:heat-inducible transcriptional repressor
MKPGVDKEYMDDRIRSVLCAIVKNYIETEEPVGSRTLSKVLELGLSPATIRNVMADLTEQGFLEQPHTSAGRVPTNRAYRYYVDVCLEALELPGEVKTVIERSLQDTAVGLENLLGSTSKVLMELTELTGVVASPRISNTRLRQIEFIKISPHRVYVVLFTQSTMAHHKMIETSEEFTQEFLTSVSRFLNEHFASCSLTEVRHSVLTTLAEEKQSYDQMLAKAVRLSRRAFDLAEERELYVEGLTNIVRGFGDLGKIDRLIESLEEKAAVIELLDRTLEQPGVNITIGMEDTCLALTDCALVTARYGNGNKELGAIGVIGPTRMNYLLVIPVIDYTARVLSQAIANQ